MYSGEAAFNFKNGKYVVSYVLCGQGPAPSSCPQTYSNVRVICGVVNQDSREGRREGVLYRGTGGANNKREAGNGYL